MSQSNPYGSPAATHEANAAVALAGRGARLGAAIIDTLILLAVLIPLMSVGGYWQAATATGGEVGLGTNLLWAAIGFGLFVAIQYVPLNAAGQTWGKKILGIRIVDLDGAKPPIGRLLGLRYLPVQLVGQVPMIGVLLGLVNVLLIFRDDRRCGHDLIAGTRVVRAS